MPVSIDGYTINSTIAESFAYSSVVTNGLQIHYDFSAKSCYPGSGTTIYNLARNSIGYMKNNVTFNSGLGGYLVTGGYNSGVVNTVGDRININTTTANKDRFDGTDNFSIFFWVNQQSASGRIMSTGSAGSGDTDNCIWQMWCDTGQFYWWNSGGGGTNNIQVSGTWHTPGTWQLIGFTYSYNEGGNDIVRCYKNDTLMMTGTTATNIHSYINRASDSTIQWTLGGGYWSSCYTINSACNIGSFSVYNRVLSSSEVNQNYQVSRGRFGV